ncbi:hypothetical protein SK128_022780 [Halocaridina rubra]|uniref:G-protein coupled receptor Mth2 n=1 Tax=Halocaridina rubra TaxID=373956 RepID=A0AAN8WNQ2_HALRR
MVLSLPKDSYGEVTQRLAGENDGEILNMKKLVSKENDENIQRLIAENNGEKQTKKSLYGTAAIKSEINDNKQNSNSKLDYEHLKAKLFYKKSNKTLAMRGKKQQIRKLKKQRDASYNVNTSSNSTQQRLFTNINKRRAKTPSLFVGKPKTLKRHIQRNRHSHKLRNKQDKIDLLLERHTKSHNPRYGSKSPLKNGTHLVRETTRDIESLVINERNMKSIKTNFLPTTAENDQSLNEYKNVDAKLSIENIDSSSSKHVQSREYTHEAVDSRRRLADHKISSISTLDSSLKNTDQRKRRARSPNKPTNIRTQTDILPDNCVLAASCSDRLKEKGVENADRYPCRCDDECHMYGDCCHDHKRDDQQASANDQSNVNETRRPLTVTTESWTCEPLMPLNNRPYLRPKDVYMVSSCPVEAPQQLADKCSKTATTYDLQRYIMDIPVVSATTHYVYANIFCAFCHSDKTFEKYKVDLVCTSDINSIDQLANMTYHPGELRWTKIETGAQIHPSIEDINNEIPRQSKEMQCLLNIKFPETVGRTCIQNMIGTCSNDWQDRDVEARCSSYNYNVEVGNQVYKNQNCALCNRIDPKTIRCLTLFRKLLRGMPSPPPSLSDIFKGGEDCEANQIWNYLHSKCEDVSCGKLFTLRNGKCVRQNNTVPTAGDSFLNSSCYTSEFQSDYSIIYPNHSVFLNQTRKLYNVGEYEFVNHSWIRVCRPDDRWTPVMNIISTVLISMSLIFMALHMIIFILLPKRRNIPSMNLFCMTVSLFISELVFVSLFNANQNYGLCVLIGVILYYFFSASFMWMNVMSIDICRTFHSQTYKVRSRKIFIQYSIYAWSVPLLVTVMALLIDQFSSPDFIIAPGFGLHRCWFNNKWGLATFYTIPTGCIFLFNLTLFGVSVYDIYKQHKSGELASSTVKKKRNGSFSSGKDEKEKEKFLRSSAKQKNNSEQPNGGSGETDSPCCAERIRDRIQKRIQAHKKQRMRLVLYSKLALIMGMTWIFAFIRAFSENIVFEYLFIILNCLQGTFIFIAFDCKQKLLDELWLKFTGKRLFRTDTKSSSNTGNTALTSVSTDGRYKYRWSSRLTQGGSTSSRRSQNEQSF